MIRELQLAYTIILSARPEKVSPWTISLPKRRCAGVAESLTSQHNLLRLACGSLTL